MHDNWSWGPLLCGNSFNRLGMRVRIITAYERLGLEGFLEIQTQNSKLICHVYKNIMWENVALET